VRHIKQETLFLKHLPSKYCLLIAVGREVDVMPAGESVGQVPRGLTMSQENYSMRCLA
jgi:hypothetical protein